MIKNTIIIFFGALTGLFYMENQVLFEQNIQLIDSKFVVENIDSQPEFSNYIQNYLQNFLLSKKVHKNNPFFKNRFENVSISFKDLQTLGDSNNQITCVRENEKINFYMRVNRLYWSKQSDYQKQMQINLSIDNCVKNNTSYSNQKIVSI